MASKALSVLPFPPLPAHPLLVSALYIVLTALASCPFLDISALLLLRPFLFPPPGVLFAYLEAASLPLLRRLSNGPLHPHQNDAPPLHAGLLQVFIILRKQMEETDN